MKIMISQPMNGKTRKQIESERMELRMKFEAEGHTVIDTIFADSPEEAQNKPVWYFSKSIEAMSTVDAVCFMEGWEEARGCKLEHQIAEAYGITII